MALHLIQGNCIHSIQGYHLPVPLAVRPQLAQRSQTIIPSPIKSVFLECWSVSVAHCVMPIQASSAMGSISARFAPTSPLAHSNGLSHPRCLGQNISGIKAAHSVSVHSVNR